MSVLLVQRCYKNTLNRTTGCFVQIKLFLEYNLTVIYLEYSSSWSSVYHVSEDLMQCHIMSETTLWVGNTVIATITLLIIPDLFIRKLNRSTEKLLTDSMAVCFTTLFLPWQFASWVWVLNQHNLTVLRYVHIKKKSTPINHLWCWKKRL